ncbi:MAG: Gfo/Idh/MocA family oxidoreductase [Thermodesulfobacteriota bacterium]|nr:Gfo/Idh/MocA family oxidoreductase [Thermodesulfobacteriota bacterium]
MADYMNIAVIGSGYWGNNLVRVFWELNALHTVCDVDQQKLGILQKKYSGIQTTTSLNDVLEDETIEAFVIATPAATHYQMVKQGLKAGKHIFVEKPLALTVTEGSELVKVSKENQRILMVGHILQYHNALIKLKELIDNGELGKVQYLYSNRLNIGKIRAEENILWSFAPHDISAVLMLLEEFPESVCATGGSYLQKGIVDVTLTTMDFPSGVKAHIFVSWLHPFKEQKLVLVGDTKMAVFNDVSEEKLLLYPHKIEWMQRTPVARKADAEIVNISMEEPLKVECKHFLECIIKGRVPKTDGLEGLRVLEILQKSQDSLNNGGYKIELTGGQRPDKKGNQRRTDGMDYMVHESSYIDDEVEIGERTKIWHFCNVLKGSRIGKNCSIGQNVFIGANVRIGNGCKIQNNVSVFEGVTLEDEVFCGPSMVFTNVFNPRSAIPRMEEIRPTLVKKGATIGANATIVCGHTIGEYAFIGAGTVVTKDLPDYALVVGNPASIIGWICQCGEKLNWDGQGVGTCRRCEKIYEKIDESCIRKR